MTIEETLERLRLLCESGRVSADQILSRIPELRESEDERIRKGLLDIFSQSQSGHWAGMEIKDIVAWLEKQKELPFVKDVVLGLPGLYFYDGERMHFQCPATEENPYDFAMSQQEEKQKEQKPVQEGLSCEELVRNAEEEVNVLYPNNEEEGTEAWERRECLREHYMKGSVQAAMEILDIKEQKPNYCHHDVDETGWTEEYRKAYYDGWNNCNMQHSQLKAVQKPEEYLDKDKVYAIMKKLRDLAFSQLIPINSDEYKKIDEITGDVRRLLDYPIKQKPAEWKEDFGEEVERVSKRYPEVSFAKLSRIAKHFAEWASGYKPAEWSKEDKEMIELLSWLLDYEKRFCKKSQADAAVMRQYEEAKKWLKSLRPHWKPSEEQMEALKNSAYGTYQNGDGPALREIYEQLKAL